MEWITLTMDWLWEYYNTEKSSVFIKPKFPTRRWGKIYTNISTTDISLINKLIEKLKKDGLTVRKRIDKESSGKLGKFYKIEQRIKNV